MKFIIYHISKCIHFPFHNLYEKEKVKDLKTIFDFRKLNIYYLVRVPRARFIPVSFKISSNNRLNLSMQYKNERFNTSSRVDELIRYRFQNENLLNGITFKTEINHEKSNDKEVHLKINQENDKIRNIVIPIETLDDYLEIKPEVIYIGQSFDILGRLKKHEKIVEIQSKKKDDEDLRIYFPAFDFGYGGDGVPNFEPMMHKIMVSDAVKDKDNQKVKIDLLERFLIYFYQPEFNTRHTKSSLKTDDVVQRNLRSEDMKGFTLNFEGLNPGVKMNLYDFWTPNQFLKEKIVSYDFTSSIERFSKGFLLTKKE